MHQKYLSRELYALTEIAKTLTSAVGLEDLLHLILEKIIGVLEPAEIGAIILWSESTGLLQPWAAFGYNLEKMRGLALSKGESVTGKVFESGQACLLPSPEAVAVAMQDIRPENRDILTFALDKECIPICTLAAPISVSDQKFGVLVLETLDGPSVFTQEDIPFVQTIADLIALAIERSRLSEREDAMREAHKAERLRSDLMATLSHELRLPLTSIQGYASMLLMDEVEWSKEKQAEFLRQIDDECHNLEMMIRQILDSSLIDADQLVIERQPVRLPQIAREVAADVQYRKPIHNIVVDFPQNFPILEVDLHWIKQVFRNILDNAIKYSPEGGLVVIHGEIRSSNIVVSVSDQGIGISPEDMVSLFERYFRVKSPDGYQIPGTGLGLRISRSIIEAHGGHIWAVSKLGEGTTLSFSLPLITAIKNSKP